MYFFYIFLLLIDRVLKFLALKGYLNGIGLQNLLSFGLEKNYFLSFGIKLNNNLIIFLSIILFILLYLFIYKKNKDVSFYLILIGAASNLFDRIFYGYVIDYIKALNVNVLNISDILIFIGFIILLKNRIYDK